MLNSDMSVSLRKYQHPRVSAYETLKGKNWIKAVFKDLSVVLQFVLTKKVNQNQNNWELHGNTTQMLHLWNYE